MIRWRRLSLARLWPVLATTALLALGCGAAQPAATPQPTALPTVGPAQIIALGDIEPDEPAKKIKRFKPLADFLAAQLADLGIVEGRVVIARDIEEMARLLRDGVVDVYFDSAFPTLAVQKLSDSDIILRRWKGSAPTYWSTYVALKNSGITAVEDLRGKTVAFEEPHSTSGFILPAGTLIQRGYKLRALDATAPRESSEEIRYVFSRDEQNTFEMLLQGQVMAGGVSNQDYDKLPVELKEQMVTFGQTIAVPRQLVSVRPGMAPELVESIRSLLMSLELTLEGKQLLEGLKGTTRFDPVSPDSEEALKELAHLIELAAKN